ncbi:hypothetical protein Tco_1089205 [Tanacetum coccineum]
MPRVPSRTLDPTTNHYRQSLPHFHALLTAAPFYLFVHVAACDWLATLYTLNLGPAISEPYQENRGLDLRRREEKSLIYNTSFLFEYECSSLALDRRRKNIEDEIESLETRLNYVSDQEIWKEKEDFSERKLSEKFVLRGVFFCRE